MDLIVAYINRRKFVTTAIKRVRMRCRKCEGRGYVNYQDDDVTDAATNRFGYSFGGFARQMARGMFSQILTTTCSACEGDCFVQAVESELTREERDEAIAMYVKHLAKREHNKRHKDVSRTWDRRTNRGDPRYK